MSTQETFRAQRNRFAPWAALALGMMYVALYPRSQSTAHLLLAVTWLVAAAGWLRWAQRPYATLDGERLTVHESPVRRKVVPLAEIDSWKYRSYLDRIEFLRDMRHPIEISLYPMAEPERERLLASLGQVVPGEILD